MRQRNCYNRTVLSVLFWILFLPLLAQQRMDNTIFIVDKNTIRQANKEFVIDRRNLNPQLIHSITFISENRSNKINYGLDTIYILDTNKIVFMGETIEIGYKKQRFYLNGFYVMPNSSSKTHENKIIMRNASLDFFFTLQNVCEPSTVSFIPLDRTNVTSGIQKKPFLLNANIQTPIALGGYRWNVSWDNKTKGIITSLHLTPQFKVRIFQNDVSVGDSSRPVRTPSYMPGGTFFITTKKLWDNNKSRHYFGLNGYHHSNGQDGNEFLSNDSINTYNGNFGEQFVFEVSYGFLKSSRSYIPKFNIHGLIDNRLSDNFSMYKYISQRYLFHWKTSYEWHPKSWSTETIVDRNLYGRTRLNIRFDAMKIMKYNTEIFDFNKGNVVVDKEMEKETLRFSLNFSYITQLDYNSGDFTNQQKVAITDMSKRMNVYLSAYRPMKNAALFAEVGYFGSDPYNIYFSNSMYYCRAGVALNYFEIRKK